MTSIRIVHDVEEYNVGTIFIDDCPFPYNYDTGIKELLCNIFDELSLDYKTIAFEYTDEEDDDDYE